jgi:hypothetical protein
MSRRRKKRALVPTMWVDWNADVAQLFTLAPASWTPPAKVKICAGRIHNTVSARFRTSDGSITTARVRIERVDGVLTVVRADMTVGLSVKSGAVA